MTSSRRPYFPAPPGRKRQVRKSLLFSELLLEPPLLSRPSLSGAGLGNKNQLGVRGQLASPQQSWGLGSISRERVRSH